MKINKTALLAALILAPIIVIGIPIALTKIMTKDLPTQNTSLSTKPKAQPKKIANYVNISASELKSYIDSDKDIYLLDVHIPEQEHISTTDAFIPFDSLDKNISELPKDKDTEIVVYCRSGNMSETASQTLIDMGYTNVKNLTGGIKAWKAEGYEL